MRSLVINEIGFIAKKQAFCTWSDAETDAVDNGGDADRLAATIRSARRGDITTQHADPSETDTAQEST